MNSTPNCIRSFLIFIIVCSRCVLGDTCSFWLNHRQEVTITLCKYWKPSPYISYSMLVLVIIPYMHGKKEFTENPQALATNFESAMHNHAQ